LICEDKTRQGKPMMMVREAKPWQEEAKKNNKNKIVFFNKF